MRCTKPILIVLAMLVFLPRAALAVTHDVSIVGNKFSPNNLTIEVGDTVRWTNSGGTHDVSADDGSWASETSGNWIFSRTFNSPGEVLYHCSVHSGPGQNINTSMNGRINVVPASDNQAPTADFAWDCTGLDCDFADQSSDSDGTIVSRSWDFGDGGVSTATNPQHDYEEGGTYDVTLTVTDDGGAVDSITKEVIANAPDNLAPEADFTFVCTALSCSFTDQSEDLDGSIASWSWNFGDGGSSTAQNPGHNYAVGGSYSVTLTVTDDDGAGDSLARTVVVAGGPSAFLINPAITDAWFDPATNGQGFFIIVWAESELAFLSWFTYDTERPPQDVTANLGEPGHRWLTAQGPYSGDTATLDVYLTAGGVFDSATPATDTGDPIGTITIVWAGCNEGLLSYELPALGLAGDIPIERIVLDKVPACEAAQP